MKLAAIGIVAGVLLSSLLIMPMQTVQAADLTYWCSTCPPAYNSSYWTVYPRYSSTHVEADSVETFDETYLDLYTGSTGLIKYVRTNDYTNLGEWQDLMDSNFSEPVGFMPPDNATITSVWMIAAFSGYHPYMRFGFSTNNASSWTYSSYMAESTSSYMTWGNVGWNVTSLTTWNATLLNSTALWAELKAYPTAGTHYYLDYLGFRVFWWAELEGGGSGGWDPEPDTEPSEPFDYSFIYSAEGMVGMMGLIGLIGMIGIPAAGVYIARNSNDSRINILVKMIALWAFCFSLFMYMVTS